MPPAPRKAPTACRNWRRERPSKNDSRRAITSPHFPTEGVTDLHATILHLLPLDHKHVNLNRNHLRGSHADQQRTAAPNCFFSMRTPASPTGLPLSSSAFRFASYGERVRAWMPG